MANFKYKALSVNGEEVGGVVEAVDQMGAVAKIKQTCPVILEIKEVSENESAQKLKKIDVQTLSLICDRFAIILNVGVPIIKAVDMLASQMENKEVQEILKDVSKDVSMGRSLYASFAAKGDVFPVTFLESVKAGEESGNLIRVFRRLKEFYEKTSKTKQKVTSSLMYPLFTLVVAAIVIVVVMVVAVPTFSKTFADLGTELPMITKVMIGMSDFFVAYGLYVLLAIGVIAIAIRAYMRTEAGAENVSKIILKLPVVGKIIQLSSASQFAHTMSMMLASGMPILRCIETSGKSIGNYVIRRDILDTIYSVEEGKSLGSCMSQSKYLPSMLVEMTTMGENTGTLETTLEAVALFYDNETEISTAKATGLLEPAIICVLALVVCLVLLSVYLPMFSMYQ